MIPGRPGRFGVNVHFRAIRWRCHGGLRIEAALDAIDSATLGQVRFGPLTQPSSDEEYTVAHCVLHAVEHAQDHLGQAYLTRQLWEAQRSAR
jgi:uncharacterized damage-inducible protein DinB